MLFNLGVYTLFLLETLINSKYIHRNWDWFMHDRVKRGMRGEYLGGGIFKEYSSVESLMISSVPVTEKISYEYLHIHTHHTRFVMQSFTFYCSWQVILRRQYVSYFRP